MEKWIQHPLIKPGKIESRLYQQILAAGVLKKGNSMIVAPTALGKTIVAALVAAERLKKFPDSKVLVLAPSKPLVIQHEESFREFLKVSTTSLTGAITPSKRVKRWFDSQIICATPQTVEADVISGRYSIEDVSLLVFDECHRGVGAYSYVYLASKYTTDGKNPLILGLTASPGWDDEKIGSVCENLFIKDVVIKSEEDADVVPYFNPVDVKWVKVELKPELKDIKSHMDKALKARLKTLKRMGIIRSVSVSKKDVLAAKASAQRRIGSSANPPKKCFLAISILAAVLNLLHSLELLETQGISNLHSYFGRLRKKRTKASKGLMNDPEFHTAMELTEKAYENGIEHPKLEKLIKILKNELKNPESRIIVFTQFRDTVNKAYDKCMENNINAVKFFGQASRDTEKGLTQKKQKEIIKNFKKGVYDVLISTSVAEEGIDIPSVDLVVLYEPVPSEIRMIQRRGRTGRKNKGRMIILMTKGTRDEAYYWSSSNKEKKMKKQLSSGYKTDLNGFVNGAEKSAFEAIEYSYKELEADENSELNDEKKERPLVYADSREGNSSVLRELDRLDVNIKVKGLAVADYQVSDEVAIERKTAKDFIGSIMDKRLHKQAKELVENFEKPVIILEGENLYSSFIHPNAVRGALASVAVDFGIPIIPTRSEADTAAMITRIAIREQTHDRPAMQIRTEKKPLTAWEQQLYIVESLPNVGPVTARKLLEEFGNVKNVINASKDELKNVEGIGDKIAQRIKTVVDSEFKTIRSGNSLQKPGEEYKLIK
ncbi:DEAD/DEAH box helicase [Methanobacterium paludis]|uniref:Helicase domain-containing protein n=1 Tax=Methanobacterium paludis (strain DSM 25820 / JCM 18151 / SWAN1) TaxID=868131 RepID=F6D6H0_METPW|nr:DEAD/DEAH box helicase [Methanobacterium paludis]AEG19403.1 helicase domain-containing protein [Methanobacterium paludis]